jgi:K+-transporting ATPase KdpF subunit
MGSESVSALLAAFALLAYLVVALVTPERF